MTESNNADDLMRGMSEVHRSRSDGTIIPVPPAYVEAHYAFCGVLTACGALIEAENAKPRDDRAIAVKLRDLGNAYRRYEEMFNPPPPQRLNAHGEPMLDEDKP